MVTLYKSPALGGPRAASGTGETGPLTKKELDTRVPPKSAPVLDEIAVNGVLIAESEILAEAQNHPSENPGGALKQAATALVIRELLWQEAGRLGVTDDLATDDKGRVETDIDAGIRALVAQEINVPMATETECLRYYERHPTKFCSGAIYEARHILFAAAENDTVNRQAAQRRANDICQRLVGNPCGFSDLAREFSDCSSRQQGGNLGQLSAGSTVGEFEQALEAMAVGSISAEPVASRYGFHIIALDRKIPGTRLPFELASTQIAAWLEAASWSKAVSQYIGVLAARAQIDGLSINEAEGPLVQ